MKHSELTDTIRLQHIQEAAEKAIYYAAGLTQTQLEQDDMRLLAITKLIEIIGEASTHISEDFKQRTPHIPWKQMIGMRNRLTHGYFDIDMDVVWKTIQNNLPILLQTIAPHLEKDSDQKD